MRESMADVDLRYFIAAAEQLLVGYSPTPDERRAGP
jgi:hypothetical protein